MENTMNDPRFDKAINYKTDSVLVDVYDNNGNLKSLEAVWYEYYERDTDVVITDHSLTVADKEDFKSALASKHRNKWIEL